MAYMRGDYYLWGDGAGGLHVWAADGYDGWDEAGWHRDEAGDGNGDGNFPVTERHLKGGENTASGVCIPQAVLDEYLMMRLAELLEGGQLEGTLDRALARQGGEPLSRHAPALREAFQRAKAERSAT